MPKQPVRMITVPADLDAVTTVGAEDTSQGVDVERIWDSVRTWYGAGAHPAIQLCLRHNGSVVLNRSIGHSAGNAPTDSPDAEKVVVTPDTPYCVYSAAKAITTTLFHMLVERGTLSLEDRVCDYLPGYTTHGKDRTTIRHVLTHSAGVPFLPASALDLDRIDDSEFTLDALYALKPAYAPGRFHTYHAATWGPLTREIIHAATGKSIRDLLAAEILDPLGFQWTNYGVAPQDLSKVALSYVTGRPFPRPIAAAMRKTLGGTLDDIIPITNDPRFLTGVLPSSNTVSTAFELSRFAEILRRGGELDGVRVLKPETLSNALTPQTRLRPDFATGLLPLRWGVGYMLGSNRFGPFGRGAGRSFGHLGLLDIAVWADPERGLSGGLISSGKPGPHKGMNLYPALMDRITAHIPVIAPEARPFAAVQ